MKARWTIPIIVVAAAVSFAAGRNCGTRGAVSLANLGDTAELEKSLKLSPQQAGLVRTLAKEFKERAGTACGRHCEARCTIARKLFQENAAPAEMQQYVDDMCAAYSEQEHATIDHLVKLRALLTAEQVKQLNKQLAMCICDKCSTTTGACCMAEHPAH